MVDPRNFVLTWEDNPDWDECVPVEYRKVIGELSRENEGVEKCPHLRKKGKIFYYCSARAALEGLEFTRTPSFNSAEYRASVDPASLSLVHESCRQI